MDRYAALLGDSFARVEAAASRARELYRGRAIWHVNSTLRGGGVAEMLRALLPYVRGAGIDTRWVVLREGEEFFALTKRIHNNLHCDRGDGGPLGEAEREVYERSLATGARHFSGLLRAGDVVFLHDPQTIGLATHAKAAGATVIWRCHIGCDEPDETALRAQDFLRSYLDDADAFVFSREQYLWPGLERARAWIMAPSIDPFSPKNQELDEATVEAILGAIGIGPRPPASAPGFTRADGTPGRVERRAELLQERPLPAAEPLLVQVSRWDRLKDHRGVLDCFVRHLADRDLRLLLAGPATAAVADDPEGAGVWNEIATAWRQLPERIRDRVHLVSLPMDDLDENAAMVNAIQRRADVVLQKSLAEGFGLTVAEAMWKGKPVVGARVGGIQDQIVDGLSGVLVDPRDLARVAAEIAAIDSDPGRAAALGASARARVTERFLGATRLAEYADLLFALEPARG
ncbi:MAG: glycosyltransferase [Solirubrobacterales bacterium]